MKKKIRYTFQTLAFAALIGLGAVPSMLGIHLLAQKMYQQEVSEQLYTGQQEATRLPHYNFLVE